MESVKTKRLLALRAVIAKALGAVREANAMFEAIVSAGEMPGDVPRDLCVRVVQHAIRGSEAVLSMTWAFLDAQVTGSISERRQWLVTVAATGHSLTVIDHVSGEFPRAWKVGKNVRAQLVAYIKGNGMTPTAQSFVDFPWLDEFFEVSE
jgi:hypothetical protein